MKPVTKYLVLIACTLAFIAALVSVVATVAKYSPCREKILPEGADEVSAWRSYTCDDRRHSMHYEHDTWVCRCEQ